ncbi:hypothetical protein HYH03_013920 [Edaphochlamys debaryana]|uniref:Peptidase M11 gametolysin domain-containing protein n=1 Tax=Edaphochlamys debaryana TaxID=47281 RepID=A0A835XMC2_9CHLO|nr:hypothetical protein HYH03_013920 [Edaphochlamys debaryana]|eukprot:KAG2487502.1 hypothetical protein HYH03_013920 [Edaphochlamys debaryana]
MGQLSRAWLPLLLLLAVGQATAQGGAYLRGRLVVLNEPRFSNSIIAPASYLLWLFDSQAFDFVLYTLRLAPGLPPPEDYLTGETIDLFINATLSGPYPGSLGPSLGPAGTLYVVDYSRTTISIVPPPDPSPLPLPTVVWVATSVCGRGESGYLGQEDVALTFFGPPPGSATSPAPAGRLPPMTLERLLGSCTFGGIQIHRSNTLIMNVTLPCSGTLKNGARWNATGGQCGTNELFGWMEAAAAATRATGLDPAVYPRRMLLLPRAAPPLCRSWQQRGTYGCDSRLGCDMWLRADRNRLLEWALTQLGSSLGLRPATAPPSGVAGEGVQPPPTATPAALADTASWPPSDPYCAMGAAQGGYRCFNGPNSFKLGVASPVRTLTSENLSFGATYQVTLPASTATPVSLLVLETSRPGPVPSPGVTPPRPGPVLFAQYRTDDGGDAGLARGTEGRVSLHLSNVSLTWQAGDRLSAGPRSRLLASLAPGQQYRYAASRIAITFVGLGSAPAPGSDPGGVAPPPARVTACVFFSDNEADGDNGCFDGVDNDCDGLIDNQDPDCAAAWAAMGPLLG